MSRKETEVIEKELEQIRLKHKGLLRPLDVVNFARNPKTALHDRFTWDDTKAAEQYRLWEARTLIEIYVTVLKDDIPPVRAYVSLNDDRRLPGGGYRSIEAVMRSPKRRALLLEQALREAERWQAKYRVLKELEPIFVQIQKVRYAV